MTRITSPDAPSTNPGSSVSRPATAPSMGGLGSKFRSLLAAAVMALPAAGCGGSGTLAPTNDSRGTDCSVYNPALNGQCDFDGDGRTAPEDCDNNNPTVFPGAEEICDDIDNDCDGVRDEEDVCATADDDDTVSDDDDTTPVLGDDDDSAINTGDDDDTTPVLGDDDDSAINTGDDDDTTPVLGDDDDSAINTGDDDDTTPVLGDDDDDSAINTGDDDDTTPVLGDDDDSAINTGDDDDSAINTGDDDDSAINTGDDDDSAVNTGDDDDSAINTGDDDDSAVNTGDDDDSAVVEEPPCGGVLVEITAGNTHSFHQFTTVDIQCQLAGYDGAEWANMYWSPFGGGPGVCPDGVDEFGICDSYELNSNGIPFNNPDPYITPAFAYAEWQLQLPDGVYFGPEDLISANVGPSGTYYYPAYYLAGWDGVACCITDIP